MTREALLTWSWLNVLNQKRYKALCDVYGDLDAALEALSPELLQSLGCRQDTIEKSLVRHEGFDVAAYERELQKRNLRLLSIEDDDYPSALQPIADAPVFLYAWGDLAVLDNLCLAIVGTRNMSPYGEKVVQNLVPEFVQAGLITVSGLARGIDTVCATSTLEAGGQTIAVLGHGFGQLQPKIKWRLAERIVQEGGVVLSEFPLDTPPEKYTFPARNRLISGLSRGVLIVEAGEGSGALITADFALDQGREVLAVPGSVFDERCKGCHQIIAKGQAKLAATAQDVFEELGMHVSPAERRTEAFLPNSPEEEQVYAALSSLPQSANDLVDRLHIEAAKLNATLTLLELSGNARNVGSGQWVRS